MSYHYGVQNAGDEKDWFDGPEIVIVAKGAHDCSRLIQAMRHGNSQQADLGAAIARSMNRKPLGRRVTELLKRHGGEDLTELNES